MEIYYLSSLDSERFSSVRKCIFLKRLQLETGKEAVLVKVIPPIIGQDFDSSVDIGELVLANRHEGEGLSPIREFPCFVFIARPLVNGISERKRISKEDLDIIAWGELYRTEPDALHHVFE